MYCCGARGVERSKPGRTNPRAEPANTPLVEQARLWHLCLRPGFWWERNSDLLAREAKEKAAPGKTAVFERLLPPRETKLRGCGKEISARDTVDWKHSAKRGSFTHAGFFQQSGIHAAPERRGARLARGGPRLIWKRFNERSNFIGWPHLEQSGADSWAGAPGCLCDARADRPRSKGFPE